MADIAKIKLPNGTTYNVKDATARDAIAKLNTFSYNISNDAGTTPQGVVWIKDGQSIEGTLVASANTMYEFYLVPNSGDNKNSYDEYVTVRSGTDPNYTYSWERFGALDIDLSDYAQKGDPVTVSGTAASHTTGIQVHLAKTMFTAIYGVKTSGNDLTASHASGANGTAPTLGTAFSVPNVTNKGSGSFTQGTFDPGSLPTAVYDSTNELLTLTVGTLPSHGADAHVHTAPTLGTKFTIPNVTDVGTASSWSFSDVAVPVRENAAYVIKYGSAPTANIPLNVTDSGHTHTVSAAGTIDD